MTHLELHILQSVPVSCLNRDDLNSPKTAIFGGVQRARVSSQSWKRAIRETAKEIAPKYFEGKRTRWIADELSRELQLLLSGGDDGEAIDKATKEDAIKAAKEIVDALLSKKSKKSAAKSKTVDEEVEKDYDDGEEDSDEIAESFDGVTESSSKQSNQKSSALYFMSPSEIQFFAKKYIEEKNKILDTKPSKKPKNIAESFLKKLKLTEIPLSTAADISLFGRMVASHCRLTVAAASMFSHAISVHRVENEIDFFSAVEELKDDDLAEGAGAGMIGTLEFNSALYYRFTALNLDMLFDDNHLKSLNVEERKLVVRAFVEATITAMPGARKNSMNANTLPSYVLGIVRDTGHPIQLINAFEKALPPKSEGYIERAVKLLESEFDKLKEKWNIECKARIVIPDVKITEFLLKMEEHVK